MTYQILPPSADGLTFSRRRTTSAERKAMGFKNHREVNHFTFEGATALAAYADKHADPAYKTRDFSKGTSGVDSTWSDMLTKSRLGDVALGESSNDLMEKFEGLMPLRAAWSTRNDVVGGLPNVPAYLAGHPLSMRRRVRVAVERAPLGVLVDLTTSAGVSRETIRKRGALVLALVRMLSVSRPVTLHVCVGLAAGAAGREDDQQDAVFVSCAVDTAPLDLARAGYLLCSPDWRMWAFSIAHNVGFDPSFSRGLWPFDSHAAHRSSARSLFDGVIPGADEVFYISPAHLNDHEVKNPEAWLTAKLAEYGDVSEDA
jgi:hypothetical protein